MKKCFFVLVLCLALISLALIIWVLPTINKNIDVTPDDVVLAASLSTNVSNGTDWLMVNYDYAMSRYSHQTGIGKGNVNQLQVKWIFNTVYPIENPPLIIGDAAYAHNKAMHDAWHL